MQWNFHEIDFVNESVGWAIGNTSNVYRTEDGGQTWKNIKKFRDDYNFTSICAVNDKIVYIDTDNFLRSDKNFVLIKK